MSTTNKRIFLAHAREDKQLVREVYGRLKVAGFEPWLDEVDLLPGQNWQLEIGNAIRESAIFLACMSKKSVEKPGYVQKELKIALSVYAEKPPGTIYFIPLRLEPCRVPDLQIPEYLVNIQNIQRVDYWEPDGFGRLLIAIEQGIRESDKNITLEDEPLDLKLKIDSPGARLSPPLKWAGGKRWLVPAIETLWLHHQGRRLIEPFCGGLSIALSLKPRQALLNDVNPHLINFYRHVKRRLSLRIKALNDERTYYDHRARFNHLIKTGRSNTADAARLFYYLNRTCFNGLWRVNRQGEFNVPFGTYRAITYLTDFGRYSQQFEDWSFSKKDFSEVSIRKNDFVYADPPHDVDPTTYGANGFTWYDQVRAAKFFGELKCPVILSNLATPRIVELYKTLGFKLQFLQPPQRISSTGARQVIREVVATKNF